MRGHWRQWLRSVHSDCMGCGIEPRKVRRCRGRGFSFARRQYVRHRPSRNARCRRPAGVKGYITCKGIVSEPGRSRVWSSALRARDGPHREGEEPKSMMHGHEKSDLAIVVMKPANKAKEAHRGGICGGGRSGVGGAKGGGQGERAPAKHALGSELGSRVTGAGAHTARRAVTHPRQEPYAGKPHVRIWAGGVR